MNYPRDQARLAILRLLREAPAYTMNQETLLSALKAEGLALNRDQIKIELTWLDGTAQAVVDRPVGGVHVATLSAEGFEFLEGVRELPGIAKPGPL